MRSNARKYNLEVHNLISHGIGVSGNTLECSVLDAFSITDNGNTINYSHITTSQLSRLSTPNYNDRVDDYLNHINIMDENVIDSLVSGGTFYTPACEIVCDLNENFIVYPFLDGVRVINVGVATGVVEYKAYPVGDDPLLYSWQRSGTFLNVDMNGTYNFIVRDYYNGDTRCKVERIIVMPNLVPSTTETIQSKLVYVNEITVGDSNGTKFNVGCVGIDSALINNEKIKVDYELGVNSIGGASCAELKCKAAGSGSFEDYCCITNAGISPKTGSFTLCAGDVMCYNSTVVSPTPGSMGYSYFNINGVDGLGTTNPSIDVSRNSERVDNNVDSASSTISLFNYAASTDTSTSCTQGGDVVISPPIPNGLSATLSIKTESLRLVDGTSSVEVWCKSSSSPRYLRVFDNTHLHPQPYVRDVDINSGDELCYMMNATLNSAGSSGMTYICLLGVSGSGGLNATLAGDTCMSISKSNPTTPKTISVCQASHFSDFRSETADGWINVEPFQLMGDQCIHVNYETTIYRSEVSINTTGSVKFYCKPNGDSGFNVIRTDSGGFIDDTILPGSVNSGGFYLRPGDQICYCVESRVKVASMYSASAGFEITGVNGENGVSASINAGKYTEHTGVGTLLP